MAKTKNRRKTRRKSKKSKRTTKAKLAGYTKHKGKYALVFKKGSKMSVGKGRYKSKKSLETAAKKYI